MRLAIGMGLIGLVTLVVLFMINGIGLFAPSRKPRPQDDPEVLTGLIARVTSAITAAASGMVVYTVEGTRHEVFARSVDGSTIQAGSDVVIEHIDGSIAFVERWEVVEGRF